MYWTKFHQTRFQVIANEFDLQWRNYIFKDDRRRIRCETALEVAIQNGHTDIVKRLIAHSNSSMECRESGGRTPLLTAARFDQTEILEFFMSRNVSFDQHCITSYQKKSGLELNKREESEFDKNMCLNNMSAFHLIAVYGSSKTLMLFNDFKYLFWTKHDALGSTPLHYLACQGRVELISHFKSNNHYDIKSFNGSTLLL
jgi:ankyrin repeat protein